MPGRRNRRKRKGYTAAIVICLLIAAGCLVYLGRAGYQNLMARRKYDAVRQQVITYEEPETEELETSSGTEVSEASEEPADESTETDGESSAVEEVEKSTVAPPFSVDFDELKAINPECVGWIYMEATKISFPIVHGEDNVKYLTTDIRGDYDPCGAIFMEADNNGTFTEPNTIIYGHNMNTGEMFAANKQYIEGDAYKTSPYFWIWTSDGHVRKYKIFSAFEGSATGDAYLLFMGRGQTFLKWQQEMKDSSVIDCGDQAFTDDDNIVTLSTCSGKDGIRRIICGIQIGEYIPPKAVAESSK